MRIKEWLSRGIELEEEIRELDERINLELAQRTAIMDALTKITPSYSGDAVQSTQDPHKFDRIGEIERTADALIDELVKEKTELNRIKKEIYSVISQVDSRRLRRILRWRYLDGLTLEEIAANKIHRSYKQACRLHGRALLMVEEVGYGRD